MREPLLGFANWRQNRSMGVFSAWEFRCSLFNAGFSVQLLLFSLFIRLRLAFCFKNELSECVNESVYCESQPCVFFLFLLLININAMLSMKWFVFSADFVRIDFNQFHCVSMSIINSLFFFFLLFRSLGETMCLFQHSPCALSLSFFLRLSSNLDLSAVLIFNLFLFWMLFRYVLWDTVKFMHGFGHIHHTSHRRIGPNIRFWMCSKLTTSGPIIYDIIRLIPIMLSIILWINQSILLLFAWLFDRLLNFFDHSNFLPCSLASFYSFSHSLSFLVQLTDSTHLPVCVYGFHRNEK